MLRELGDPQICWEKFLKQEDKGDGPVGEHDCEDECAADVPSAPLAEVKERLNRATGLHFDLLLKVMAGRDYL